MAILVTNDATGTLAGSINDSVLTLSLGTGQGALFPNPTGGDFFYVTLTRASDGGKEIVKCTARSTDTLTIVRAQDGTTAKSFASADRVELRPIRAIHEAYAQLAAANTFVGNQTVTGSISVSNDVTIADDLIVGDDASIAGDLAVSGNETVTGTLTVTGTISCANGSLMASRKIDALNAGVGVLFRQASVPTGWTKDTTYNNAAIRIVSGTPSQQSTAGKEFTTLLAARTIAAANLPDHTITITDPGHFHTTTYGVDNVDGSDDPPADCLDADPAAETTYNTDVKTTGITAAFGNTARGGAQTAMDFAVNYVDFYLATKDA